MVGEIPAENYQDYLRRYIELKNGIPSHDTIRRVIGMISSDILQQLWSLKIDEKRIDGRQSFMRLSWALIFILDRDTGPVILLNLIKGSNLRLEICVCSVVSTVETSGAAGKWWDFYCIFCCAIKVSFFISFYQKNPLLHKKITVGEYLQKRRQR